MSSAKKGSAKSSKRSAGKRAAANTHVIDFEPESPVIREHEAVARRRRGYRTALWLITAMLLAGLGWVAWHEALEKNKEFLLKRMAVNTSGPLTKEQIGAATGLTTATNLRTLNLREVRHKIERLPQVKSATLRRDYHGVLSMDVQQRIPVAWIVSEKHRMQEPLTGKGCLLDAEGAPVPCEVMTKAYLALPRIVFPALSEAVPGRPAPDLQLHAALRLMEKLQQRDEDGRAELERIEIPNEWSLVAHFTGETRVLFGVDDFDLQIARFDRFMAEAKTRKWRVATLDLMPQVNTPVTFHETPDISGLLGTANHAPPASVTH